MFDTETPAPFRAPIGKWRVVEVGWLGGDEALAAIDSIHQNPDGQATEYQRQRPLHAVIGDFDSITEALTVVEQVRSPWERVVFNDEGVQICAFRRPLQGIPNAGAES